MTCKTLDMCLDRTLESLCLGQKSELLDCSSCQKLFDEFDGLFQDLGLLGMHHQPPTRVKAQVMQRILEAAPKPEQPWKTWTNQVYEEGLKIVPKTEDNWQSTEHQGVFVRPLAVIEGNDKVKMLVRMQPGASYPPHVHSGFEDCYVLKGSIHVGDILLEEGDYQCSDGGSIHATQATEKGCLLLITSSIHDELFQDFGC